MGWGQALGGFFEGYQKTMAQRHSQREQQFTNLMGLAQKYRDIADRERSKTVLDKNSETIITEAEMNAQKAVMQAEKAMNEHIGGLSKLGGLFKRLMASKAQGGEAGQGSEAESSPAQESSVQSPSMSEPGSQESPVGEAPPPAFRAFTPQQQQWIGLPPPPDQTPAQAPASVPAGPSQETGLLPGQYINPEVAARQRIELNAAIEKARATGKVGLEQKLEENKKIFEQNSALREAEFNKFIPEMQQRGVPDKEIQRIKMAYMTGMQNVLKTGTNKPIIDRQRPFQGPDGKWYSNTYVFDDETGQYTMGDPVETGPPSAITNISAKMQEKIKNYRATHPNVTSDEEAENAVRSAENQLLENKLKSSNWKAVSDQHLAAYRGDRTRFYKEAQEARKQGKGMTPQLAQSVLVHADSMAKLDVGDLARYDGPEEARYALLNASNAWLMNNVGLSRDELQTIITAKPKESLEDRTKKAKENLVKPPSESGQGTKPGKKTGASTNPP